MKIYKNFLSKPARILKVGGIGVIPTDTLYGIVAAAMNKKAVERVYRLRQRTPWKPVIILISSSADLKKFGITPSDFAKKFIDKHWPGKVSVILPMAAGKRGLDADLPATAKAMAGRRGKNSPEEKFHYLHRGKKSLAFRVPDDAKLRAFLKKTGPLVAPSANPEGEPPAKTIAEAKKYFPPRVSSPSRIRVRDKLQRGSGIKTDLDSRSESGITEENCVDFYIDAGRKDSKPSTLVKILGNKVIVLRQGAVKIP